VTPAHRAIFWCAIFSPHPLTCGSHPISGVPLFFPWGGGPRLFQRTPINFPSLAPRQSPTLLSLPRMHRIYLSSASLWFGDGSGTAPLCRPQNIPLFPLSFSRSKFPPFENPPFNPGEPCPPPFGATNWLSPCFFLSPFRHLRSLFFAWPQKLTTPSPFFLQSIRHGIVAFGSHFAKCLFVFKKTAGNSF